jgi:hypothetical protein
MARSEQCVSQRFEHSFNENHSRPRSGGQPLACQQCLDIRLGAQAASMIHHRAQSVGRIPQDFSTIEEPIACQPLSGRLDLGQFLSRDAKRAEDRRRAKAPPFRLPAVLRINQVEPGFAQRSKQAFDRAPPARRRCCATAPPSSASPAKPH